MLGTAARSCPKPDFAETNRHWSTEQHLSLLILILCDSPESSDWEVSIHQRIIWLSASKTGPGETRNIP